jgi:hypothetical protein
MPVLFFLHNLHPPLIHVVTASVAEPHHFDPALGKNFDAAPAPTQLISKAKFLKRTKV